MHRFRSCALYFDFVGLGNRKRNQRSGRGLDRFNQHRQCPNRRGEQQHRNRYDETGSEAGCGEYQLDEAHNSEW